NVIAEKLATGARGDNRARRAGSQSRAGEEASQPPRRPVRPSAGRAQTISRSALSHSASVSRSPRVSRHRATFREPAPPGGSLARSRGALLLLRGALLGCEPDDEGFFESASNLVQQVERRNHLAAFDAGDSWLLSPDLMRELCLTDPSLLTRRPNLCCDDRAIDFCVDTGEPTRLTRLFFGEPDVYG